MNFLSISFDDLNAFAFLKSLYPGVLHTPNLDRVMAMGTTFENAFAQIAVCNASRTSILSGRDPSDTGVHFNFEKWYDHVAPSETLPGLLHGAGLKTGIFGKVFHDQAPAELEPQFADLVYRTAQYDPGSTTTSHPFSRPAEEHGDYLSTSAAVDYLGAVGSNPFAIFLGLYKPHLSWDAPQEYYDLYPLESITLPFALDGDLSDVPAFMRDLITDDHGQILSTVGWQKALQGYFASLSFADAQLGRILDALETSGHADDTAIVVWTDHGFHLGDKDNWHKFTLWDESGRAPMIVALPGEADNGQRVGQVVELVDLMPTVLDLMGLAPPAGLSGKSLVPFLSDPGLITDGYAVTTMYGSASIRTNTHRFTLYEDGSTELYDIVADPNQWTNLAGDPASSTIVEPLTALLREDLGAQGWRWTDAQEAAVGSELNEQFVVAAGASASGAAGDDIYFLADASSSVSENVGEGTDKVFVDFGYTLPDQVENLEVRNSSLNVSIVGNELANTIFAKGMIRGLGGDDEIRVFSGSTVYGGEGNDYLQGQASRDHLLGESGDDLVNGGSGNDILEGGAGTDFLTGHKGIDTAAYRTAGQGVFVDLQQADYQETGGAGSDMLASIENLDGSDHSDILAGSSEDNALKGFGGDDVIVATAGDDTYDGGNGIDRIDLTGASEGVSLDLANTSVRQSFMSGWSGLVIRVESVDGGTGNDILSGNGASNALRGGDGDNKLFGLTGNDTLSAGIGADLLDGGSGYDTVDYSAVSGPVTVSLATAEAQDTGGAGFDTLLLVENVIGTAFADAMAGSAAANLLEGGIGDDRLDGLGGADALLGGEGRDILSGGNGSDTMTGGIGDDEYHCGSVDDLVVEGLDSGHDIIVATVELKLAENVEDLRLTGSARRGWGNGLSNVVTGSNGSDVLAGEAGHDVLIGGWSADELSGGAGDDVLLGQAGGDFLYGGEGTDIASYALAAARVVVDLAITSAQATYGDGTDTLTDIESLLGSAFADRLHGDDLGNVVEGGGGDDFIDGRGGTDIASYAGADGGVSVNLVTLWKQATGGAGTDILRNVEGLVGSDFADSLHGNVGANDIQGGAGDDTLAGNQGDDTLSGGDGADVLIGSDGQDAMKGGSGDDLFYVHQVGDSAIENAGEGTDTIVATVDYVLEAGIENLFVAAPAQAGTGNDLANMIFGGSSDERLQGLGGDDQLRGREGIDFLSGGDNADRLLGGAGSDELVGGEGDDWLAGDAGNDVLTGGTGRDGFAFGPDRPSADRAATDLITDFNSAEGDRIYLSAIDAVSSTVDVDEAFAFIGSGAFSANGSGGELRFEIVGASTFLEGDVDGDGLADFAILLQGAQELAATDIQL